MMTTALFPTHAVLHCWFYKQKVTYKYDPGILGKAACADMPLKSRSISAVWSSVSIFLIEATLLE